MLQKWRKFLSLSSRFLFFTIISGMICYFGCDGMRKNEDPVKIYRVTEPVKEDAPSNTSALPSRDTPSNSNFQKGTETADTYPSPKSVSISPSDPSTTSGEFGQQDSDLKTFQQNDEVSSKEETEQKKEEIQTEIRRLEDSMRETQNSLARIVEKHNTLKRNYEQRYYKVADKLNALSAEEQQAYLRFRF